MSAVHLGHYFGALRYHLDLHHEYPGHSFYLIADYHGLTRQRDPDRTHGETLELATSYLAFGLDPSKAVLYRQSDVPECTELAWILSCLISEKDLRTLPTFKKPSAGQRVQSVGLLSYPILMAADILAVRGTVVPVGGDQIPNLNRVRRIAKAFNSMYKTDLFPIPEARITTKATIKGTDGLKMSVHADNHLPVFTRFDRLASKVAKIQTDSRASREPKDPSKCGVFSLFALVAGDDKVERMRESYASGIDYHEVKRQLTLSIQEYFMPYEDRYYKLKERRDDVMDILRQGARRASEEVSATREEVRRLVGLAS